MGTSDIERALQIDRTLRPNYYERTEAIAKIIDASAFADDWVIPDRGAAELHALKLGLLRASAMRKAHEVLAYLGVNSECDWMMILTQLAATKPEVPHAR